MNKKISMHLAALASATAGAAVANNADAAIVYSGLVNINVPSTTAGVYLNVVTGVFNTAPALAPGWDVNPWGSTANNFFNPAAPAGGVYSRGGGASGVGNLPAGYVINAANLWTSGGFSTTAGWTANLGSSNNIVGFRFQNELNGNQIHYGWMRLSLATAPGGQPRAIVEYAYENVAGAGIEAGAIPTPGAVSLLAVGAAGLVGRRRRA